MEKRYVIEVLAGDDWFEFFPNVEQERIGSLLKESRERYPHRVFRVVEIQVTRTHLKNYDNGE